MDKGHPASLVAMSVVLPVLGVVCTGLRFLGRRENRLPLGWDDWLLLPAVVINIGMGVALIFGVAKHVTAYPRPSYSGAEQLYADPPQKILEQKVEYAVTFMFIVLLGFVKCSLLFFFSRVFCPHRKGVFFILTRVAIGTCAVWSVGFALGSVFDCGLPFSNKWAPLIVWGRVCHSLPWQEGFVISDFMIDVGLVVMPIPMIWRLKMSWGRKVGVTLLMAVGTMAVIASLIRVIIVFTVVHGVESAFTTADGNILDTEVLWWCMLEAGLSIVVTSLPAVYSLPGRVYLRNLSSTSSSMLAKLHLSSARKTSKSHPELGQPTQMDGTDYPFDGTDRSRAVVEPTHFAR